MNAQVSADVQHGKVLVPISATFTMWQSVLSQLSSSASDGQRSWKTTIHGVLLESERVEKLPLPE